MRNLYTDQKGSTKNKQTETSAFVLRLFVSAHGVQATMRGLQEERQRRQQRELQGSSSATDSYDYYRNLLRNLNNRFAQVEGSDVLLVTPAQQTPQRSPSIRLLHLLQLLPVSEPGSTTPVSDLWLYLTVPGITAMHHFNQRNNSVVKGLSGMLSECNLHLTMDLFDTQFSNLQASRQLMGSLGQSSRLLVDRDDNANKTFLWQRAGAVVGPGLSEVAQTVATLTGTYRIPQISPTATSSALESRNNSPTLARTVPTNAGDAQAIVAYLHQHLQVQHVGVIYLHDDYGTSYFEDFAKAARRAGMSFVSASYTEGDAATVQRALQVIKESHFRYIFAVALPSGFELLLQEAVKLDLVGPDFFWALSSNVAILDDGGAFKLNRTSQPNLVKAMQGIAIVSMKIEPNPVVIDSLDWLRYDTAFRDFFIESHPDSEDFYKNLNWTDRTPVFGPFTHTAYDAVMAIGIAACQTPNPFFTGAELYQQILQTRFEGASGLVSFDSETGTRSIGSLQYGIYNVFADAANSNDEVVAFQSRVVATIRGASDGTLKTTILNEYIYNDNSNIPPLALPPVQHRHVDVPFGIRCVGWVLAGLIMACVLYLGCFIWSHRKKPYIRAAQPVFLGMMLVGTFLMAASIVPMSFQESFPPSQGSFPYLDVACMATPWLFVMGFSTACSAVLAKTKRLYLLVRHSVGMKRVQVLPRDVMAPVVILTISNTTVLFAWTMVSPWRWEIVHVDSFDSFGRSTESFGRCHGDDYRLDNEWDLSTVLVIVLFTINFLAVVFANYQSYQTRHMPTDFNESYYLALGMKGLLEAFLVGAPILFVINDNPVADFVIQTLIVVFICLSILVPLFGSKILLARRRKQRDASVGARDWRTAVSHPESGAVVSSNPSTVAQLRANVARKDAIQVEEEKQEDRGEERTFDVTRLRQYQRDDDESSASLSDFLNEMSNRSEHQEPQHQQQQQQASSEPLKPSDRKGMSSSSSWAEKGWRLSEPRFRPDPLRQIGRKGDGSSLEELLGHVDVHGNALNPPENRSSLRLVGPSKRRSRVKHEYSLLGDPNSLEYRSNSRRESPGIV